MNKKTGLTLLALILALTFLCFAPALKNGFTHWDDTQYVQDNAAASTLSGQNVGNLFSTFYQGNYIPLTFLSYAAERTFFGDSPFVFILTNILLHLLNTLLVYLLAMLLLKNRITALVCALLFGIHTLHVESVAWIAERKDVLYACFFFLSLITYIHYSNSGKLKWYFCSLLLLLLSVLSKSMAIMLPFVLLLLDMFLGRAMHDKKIWLEKIPFVMITILFTYAGMIAVKTNGAGLNSYHLSFFERIPLACYAMVCYFGKMLLPVHLSAYYPYPMSAGEGLPVWMYLLAVVIIAAVIFLFIKKNKKVTGFGVLFFTVMMVPALQLFPVGDSLMGDRFTYVGSFGIFLLAGYGVQISLEKKGMKMIALCLLAVYTGLLFFFTRERVLVWKNGETLWADVIKKYDRVPLAYINHGNALYEKGDNDGAVKDYDKAIHIDTNSKDAYFNRAVIRFQAKQFDKAAADLGNVLRISPSDKDALYTRALSYIYSGKSKEALSDLNAYIAMDNSSSDAFAKRGVLRIQQGDSTGACNDWHRAVELGSEQTKEVLKLYCK